MTKPRSRKLHRQRHPKPAPGSPPGVLVPRADGPPLRLARRRFSSQDYEEEESIAPEDAAGVQDSSHCVWVDGTGIADPSVVTTIGRTFGLHELSLEDVLDPSQRSKVEHYDNYTFVVLKILSLSNHVETHQLNLFFGENFVVTLQDGESSVLEPVRQRLKNARGQIRSRRADYLAYTIIDTVIDHYFPVLEEFDDRLERLEDTVLETRAIEPIDPARALRGDLHEIRHAVWPARQAVTSLLREDTPRITPETRLHLQDCYDHLMRLQDMVEYSREIAASLLEAYVSKISLRTNEVMKVLTVIATIFIPLTFITSLYGMNFNPTASPFNMPELNWYLGYPFALLVMLGAATWSLIYFRRKGWFGTSDSPEKPLRP